VALMAEITSGGSSGSRLATGRPLGRRAWPLLREVVLIGALLATYTLIRAVAGEDVDAAFDHAGRVLQVEQWLHLPSETDLQTVLLAWRPLTVAANGYYAAAHLPVTFLALLWLFLRHPAHYAWARRALVSATTVALAVYLLVPVAPPRMLTGFVDTATLLGQSVYGSPGGSSIADQYAAMPSLHVGWAILVATVGISAARSRWRWLWLVHPVVTVLVVVSTGNHYWLDGIAGAAVVTGALVATRHGMPNPVAATRRVLHAVPHPHC
jgi:hypothetical protein